MYQNADEIIPGLYLGDRDSSVTTHFLKYRNIELVVNCTKTEPFQKQLRSIECLRIPIDDKLDLADSKILLRELPMVIMKIDSYLQQGRNVLVHCFAGVQRSAATVAAYLMFKQHMTAKQAVQYIRSKRRVAFHPRVNFQYTLDEFEKELKNIPMETFH